LQQLANSRNFLLLFVDHHAKPKGMNPNPVDDLMSSTAKSAVADTLAGLYRDDVGKKKLMVTGRDVENTTIVVRWDRQTAAYQVVTDEVANIDLSPNEVKVYRWLKENKRGRMVEIARGIGINSSNLSPILKRLVSSEVIGFDNEKSIYHIDWS